MTLWSISAYGRVSVCAASAALPQVATTDAHRRAGTGRHNFLSSVVLRGQEAALAAVKDEAERARYARMDVDALLRFFRGCSPARTEVAYAYDPERDKGRELGVALERAYERAGLDVEHEVPGTADLEALSQAGDEVRILDMKNRVDGDPAQLDGLVLAACRAHGVNSGRGVFAYHQDDGSFQFGEVRIYDAMDLAMVRASMLDTQRRVRAARQLVADGRVPDVEEGAHCEYCPAARSCHAKQSLILAAAGHNLPLPLPAQVAALAPAARAKAYEVLKALKPRMEELETALKESARTEPIELADGTVVREVPGNEAIDSKIALKVMEDVGLNLMDVASSVKITKALIERVCTDGSDVEMVLGKIREAGGFIAGAPSVKEVKPRKPRRKAV